MRGIIGKYVQAYNPYCASGTMEPRTDGCIILFPAGNMDGSYKMYSIRSAKVISRDKWISLPMPSDVVAHMNALADRDIKTWAELDFEDDPSPVEEETPLTKVSLEELADPSDDEPPALVHDIGTSDNDEEEQYDGHGQFVNGGAEPTPSVLTKDSDKPETTTLSEVNPAPTRYNLKSRSSGTRTRFELSGAIAKTTPVDIAFHMTI